MNNTLGLMMLLLLLMTVSCPGNGPSEMGSPSSGAEETGVEGKTLKEDPDTPKEELIVREKRFASGKLMRQWTEKAKANGKYVMHGPYKIWYENGQLMLEREFIDGKPQGPYVQWREGGSLDEKGEYLDGNKHGTTTRYHANGKVMQTAEYNKGKLHGKFICWDKEGGRVSEKEFINGLEVSYENSEGKGETKK